MLRQTKEKIKDHLEEPTPQGLKKTLRKLKIRRKDLSYLLSEITGEQIPEISAQDRLRAEQMFMRLDKVTYYPDAIYEIFYEINSNHPLLKWIPRRC